jgi:hypothetical protein
MHVDLVPEIGLEATIPEPGAQPTEDAAHG